MWRTALILLTPFVVGDMVRSRVSTAAWAGVVTGTFMVVALTLTALTNRRELRRMAMQALLLSPVLWGFLYGIHRLFGG